MHPPLYSNIPLGQKQPETHWRVHTVWSGFSHVSGQAVPQVWKILPLAQVWVVGCWVTASKQNKIITGIGVSSSLTWIWASCWQHTSFTIQHFPFRAEAAFSACGTAFWWVLVVFTGQRTGTSTCTIFLPINSTLLCQKEGTGMQY